MEIKHENLIGTFEQKKAQVKQFNLMHDDFFAVVMQDKKTIKNIELNLSVAMKKAIMLELIPKNPCENLTLPKLQKFQPDVYNMEEVAQLLNCAKDTDLYLSMMIEICLGLRRRGLLALKWHHVDLEKGILSV